GPRWQGNCIGDNVDAACGPWIGLTTGGHGEPGLIGCGCPGEREFAAVTERDIALSRGAWVHFAKIHSLDFAERGWLEKRDRDRRLLRRAHIGRDSDIGG